MAKIIMSIGRVSPDKRPQDAIKIVRIVRKSVHDAELLWVGGGSDLLNFQRLRGEEPYLNFVGQVSNKWELLRRSHAYVSTSAREGFNLPIGEALLAGVPTIAYDLPVYRHVYGSVVIYIPRFDVDAFAEAVIDVLRHPEKYKQTVEEGRSFVSRSYDSNAVVRQIEESIANLLKGHSMMANRTEIQ